MKKILLISILFAFAATLNAQKPKPKAKPAVKKTTTIEKKAKPKPEVVESAYDNLNGIDIYTKDDKGMYVTSLNKGDKLVYEINANGQTYDFIITPQSFSQDNGFVFDYETTNANKTSGKVTVMAAGRNEGTKYVNFFNGGELVLTDATTVMYSAKNFMDMPTKKTQMALDGGAEETFYRAEKDEVIMEIDFKGKKVSLDAFQINNAQDGTGNKTMWIQGSSGCPLILYMNLGWTVKLKAII
jgi:hypothetical protein